MGFYAQGGSREVWGREDAVQGSQMDPLDDPIAGLVEGNTFIRLICALEGQVRPCKTPLPIIMTQGSIMGRS